MKTKAWPTFKLDRPHMRVRGGKPLVVLTEPAQTAIVINAEGDLEVCSLLGVGQIGLALPILPTPEQRSTMARMSVCPVFGHDGTCDCQTLDTADNLEWLAAQCEDAEAAEVFRVWAAELRRVTS